MMRMVRDRFGPKREEKRNTTMAKAAAKTKTPAAKKKAPAAKKPAAKKTAAKKRA